MQIQAAWDRPHHFVDQINAHMSMFWCAFRHWNQGILKFGPSTGEVVEGKKAQKSLVKSAFKWNESLVSPTELHQSQSVLRLVNGEHCPNTICSHRVALPVLFLMIVFPESQQFSTQTRGHWRQKQNAVFPCWKGLLWRRVEALAANNQVSSEPFSAFDDTLLQKGWWYCFSKGRTVKKCHFPSNDVKFLAWNWQIAGRLGAENKE